MVNKQPSYIDYINNFWKLNDDFQFSSTQAHCYFTLLSVFNRRKWVKELPLSDLILREMMGISLNTLRRAKEVLMEQGLISFIKGGKGYSDKTRYQLRYQASCESRGELRGQNGNDGLTSTPIYKNIDYKTKNNNGTKKGFNISKGDFD